MAIDRAGTWINIFLAAAAILVALYGIAVTRGIADRGDIPPKSLKYYFSTPRDSLEDLANEDSQLIITVKNEGDKLKNLFTALGAIENNGSSPITPDDIISPLTIRTKKPWRIVNVVSENVTASSPSVWSKASDTEFHSVSLINPGKRMNFVVYLTWNDKSTPPASVSPPQLDLVPNIKNLKELMDKIDYAATYEPPTLMLTVWDGGIVFVIISYCVFHILTISLLIRSGIVAGHGMRSILIMVLSGAVNILGAASGAAFVFGPFPYGRMDVSAFAHFFVGLNLVMIVGLWWMSRRSVPPTTP